MKKYTILFLIVCSLLSFSQIALSKPLMICIVQLERWGEVDPSTQKLVGIYPDLFREFLKRTQTKANFQLAPYSRVMRTLESGRCDLSATIPADSIKNSVQLGEEIWTIKHGLYTKPEQKFTEYGQLKGLNIGVLRVAAITPKFDSDTSFNKVTSTHYSNLLSMLARDRIQGVVADVDIINTILNSPNGQHLRFADPLILNEQSITVIMSNSSGYLAEFDRFNAALSSITDDGTLKQIVYHHLSTSPFK